MRKYQHTDRIIKIKRPITNWIYSGCYQRKSMETGCFCDVIAMWTNSWRLLHHQLRPWKGEMVEPRMDPWPSTSMAKLVTKNIRTWRSIRQTRRIWSKHLNLNCPCTILRILCTKVENKEPQYCSNLRVISIFKQTIKETAVILLDMGCWDI